MQPHPIPISRPLDRVAGLDNLRALAIVCVMLFHLCGLLPAVFSYALYFGWMGVDLFFVLSGYLIGLQLLRTVRDGGALVLRAFYRRRAYRILPAYLVVVALYELWPGWRGASAPPPLWQLLTFTENLFVPASKGYAFQVVWSLCVEEHFYLLLPLMVIWLARKPSLRRTVVVLGLFVALGIAVRGYALLHVLRHTAPTDPRYIALYLERIYYPTWSHLDGLLAGVALALVRTFRPVWWTALVRYAGAWLVAGTVLVGVAVWMFQLRFWLSTGVGAAGTVIGFPVLSLGLALWLPAASDVRCRLARLRVPGAQPLAVLAYSLYLTHPETAHLVHTLFPQATDAHRWRTVPIYGGSCLVVAAVLYYAVERPFLRLREHREGRGLPNADAEAQSSSE